MGEAFSTLRVAIEAALHARRLKGNYELQKRYIEGDPQYVSPTRYYKGEIGSGKETNQYVKKLVGLWEECSKFSAHADFRTFSHRLNITGADDQRVDLLYFHHPPDVKEFGFLLLVILHSYTVILSVFSEYLVEEKKSVGIGWVSMVEQIGSKIEQLTHTRQEPDYEFSL